MLMMHQRAQSVERERVRDVWADHDLVFPDPRGRPQYRQAFLRDFRALVKSAEIAKPETVNWHGLRHTAASLWIKAGVDIFTVSRRLGHASASFTMNVYGHMFSGQQQAAAVALDHLIRAR